MGRGRGRPSLGDKGSRVQISFRMTVEDVARLEKWRATLDGKRESLNQTARRLVLEWLELEDVPV